MEFKEEYISAKENAEKPDAKKITISNEAFAIGDMIERLINKLESARISIINS